jgi:hypothetical protein
VKKALAKFRLPVSSCVSSEAPGTARDAFFGGSSDESKVPKASSCCLGEDFWVAEEARDVDEKVLGQQVEFVGVMAQKFEIAIHIVGFHRRHGHAPFGPALQRAALVQTEVMRRSGAQQRDDR